MYKIATAATACTLVIVLLVYNLYTGDDDRDELTLTAKTTAESRSEENKPQFKTQAFNTGSHIEEAQIAGRTGHPHDNDNTVIDAQTIDRSFWFDEPALESDTHFVAYDTAILFAEDCRQSRLPSEKSLEHNFAATHRIDARERFPEDFFYYTLTQFWQLDGRYYQFVAIWERDMPARYRYEFYVANQADFLNKVNPINFPIPAPTLRDVQETNRFVTALLDHYNDQGATLGARILEGAVNLDSGEESVVLVNSKITRWSTENFSCRSQANSQHARCDCRRKGENA